MHPRRPIVLVLTEAEAAELTTPVGIGGHQSFQRDIKRRLAVSLVLTLSDPEMGRLMRYISHGRGGFQGRLRRAFMRSITELLE